jgi:hypothetical protein
MMQLTHELHAILEDRGVLIVNRDYRIHLGRWRRVLAGEIPPRLFLSSNYSTRRLILRIPGLCGAPNPGELCLEVHGAPARSCVYLPVSRVDRAAGLEALGITVGSLLDVTYGVTSMTLRRIR